MTSVILSGGRNLRYPGPKGFIEIEGKRIIETVLQALTDAGCDVVISTNDPESYFYLGVPLVGDVRGSAGPMSGIYSALYATGSPDVLVAACDMPFIKSELVSYIIKSKAGQATVPVYAGRPEPLLAVYSAELMEKLEGFMDRGETSLTRMLDEIEVRFVPEEDIRRIDPDGRSFMNINTPEDLDRAISAAARPGAGPRKEGKCLG